MTDSEVVHVGDTDVIVEFDEISRKMKLPILECGIC
jgi:hypothetical protein